MSWNVRYHLSSLSESGTFFALRCQRTNCGSLFFACLYFSHLQRLPAAGRVAQEGGLLGKDLMTLHTHLSEQEGQQVQLVEHLL